MRQVSSVIRSIEGKTLETNKRRRTVRAVWSDDSTDHYRTVFHQGGIDTSVFAANPVILFEHGKHPTRAGLPIGNALEWGVEKHRGRNALIGVARFHDDEFSNDRFEDYAAGRMRGWSINALPLDASPPTPAERRARPEWNSADTVFREVRLLEVSATALPGNAGTLTLSVERGFSAAAAARCPDRRYVAGLLDDVNKLQRLRPSDGTLAAAARVLTMALRVWGDPVRREMAWVAAAEILRSRKTARRG